MTPEPPLLQDSFCWACQQSLSINEVVWISGSPIPCCDACWKKMPVADQLRIGQMFQDRAEGGAIDAVRTVFRSALGNFLHEKGDDWLRGSGN